MNEQLSGPGNHLMNFTEQNPYYFLHKAKSIVILLFMTVLLACKTDLDTISIITKEDETPLETAFDVKIVYSEHAKIKMILESPKMDKYQSEERNFLEMPDGVNVLFFDSIGQQTSSLRANYAISYEEENIMEAHNDVVVINEKNEKLNTEHLIWDRNKQIIFTEKFVKITTDEEVLFGDGLESDERFDQWVIKRPRGVFSIETGD